MGLNSQELQLKFTKSGTASCLMESFFYSVRISVFSGEGPFTAP